MSEAKYKKVGLKIFRINDAKWVATIDGDKVVPKAPAYYKEPALTEIYKVAFPLMAVEDAEIGVIPTPDQIKEVKESDLAEAVEEEIGEANEETPKPDVRSREEKWAEQLQGNTALHSTAILDGLVSSSQTNKTKHKKALNFFIS